MGRALDPELARHVARAIVGRLHERGHVAYFAGGCVRDELLGLHPTDFDVATDATPVRVRELFQRTNEVGVAFGVMLVADDGSLSEGFVPGLRVPSGQQQAGQQAPTVVEVATFRADGHYSDARRPDSVRFSDARSDAARRDFTINALFLDPLTPAEPGAGRASGLQGQLIDYVGGLADLDHSVLRAVGDAGERLTEDHLRALRAVRFSARLGFEIEQETREAIRRHAADLRGVSRERIGDELRRMLTHPSRAQAAALLRSLGLETAVLGDPALAASGDDFAALAGLSIRGQESEPIDFGVALAAWVLDRQGGVAGVESRTPAEAEAFCKSAVSSLRRSLCLSNDECERLSGVLSTVDALLTRFDSSRVSVQKRIMARAGFSGSMRVLEGVEPRRVGPIALQGKNLADDGVGLWPEPFITGDDLVASGMRPGPRFKGVLDEVFDAQLEGRVGSKAEAMELARRLSV